MDAKKYQEKWAGGFGNDYQARNSIKKDDRNIIWGKLFKSLNLAPVSFLEVGCSRGHNLYAIRSCLGCDVQGIEINEKAISERYISNIVKGSAYDLPFIDGQFELVFTAGVLIHLSETKKAMEEIKRVSSKYILSIEYYTEKPREINYRDDVYCYAKDWPKLWEELGCKVIDHGEMKDFGETKLGDDFSKACHYTLVQK